MGRTYLFLLDAAVPLVAGAVAVVGILVHGDHATRPFTLALALGTAAVLAARRRAPLATLAVSGGLVLALLVVDHTAGAAAMFAPAVALYSVALTRGRMQQLVAAAAAVAAVIASDIFLGGGAFRFATLGHAALVAVPLLAAEAVRNRRSYITLLLERLELAERAREEEAQRRVEHERLRISRDLHDSVAHSLTTINVQAGVAAHLLRRDTGDARAARALETIESASHEALDELRAVVGVLREQNGEHAPLDPAPTLDAVDELVEQARTLGLDVSLDIRGRRPARLSEAVQLAAFRIVQESLTNARRHAAGTAAYVGLRYEADRLLITIENGAGATSNGTKSGVGVGIIGMHERAAAVGGALQATAFPDGFRVSAELPYRRAE
ncbi:MAG TPA: histidine kinase [Gaiellaceae bacterium]|nr:histidine kinase [Gaiellaceae bacterium]